jgi:hypothetical protein
METKPMIYVCIPTTPERTEKLARAIASIHKSTIPHTICTYTSQGEGSVKGILKLLEGIHGLVAWLDDDCEVTPDYLELLYNGLVKAFPDFSGVAYGYDEFHKDKLVARPLCHSSIIKKYLYSGYYAWFADTEFDYRLRQENRIVWVPEAKTIHHHYLKDPKLMDKTYQGIQNHSNADKALFYQRMKIYKQ